MKEPEKHLVKLWLGGVTNSRIIIKKEIDGKPGNFKAPVTTKGIPKIYILKVGSNIVYVGYTSQSLTSRFNGGLKANGKNGYYGYQWKKYSQLDLIVFCFKPFSKAKKKRVLEEQFIQAIEAELVFNIRLISNQWPECQNEIHFYNMAGASTVAEEILESLI